MPYNSCYLEEDEVDYELRIRGFSCDGRLDEKRRTLRRCLSNERKIPLHVPNYSIENRTEIDSEILVCKEKLDRLSENLNHAGAPRQQDSASQYKIFTLLLHLTQRLNRLKPNLAEDISRVASLNKVVAEIKENYYPVEIPTDSDEETAAKIGEISQQNVSKDSFGSHTETSSTTPFVVVSTQSSLDVNLFASDSQFHSAYWKKRPKNLVVGWRICNAN
jgi:hypothetical protein